MCNITTVCCHTNLDSQVSVTESRNQTITYSLEPILKMLRSKNMLPLNTAGPDP